LTIGADERAVAWLRRSIDVNRTFPLAHFFLAALANLGKLDEARAETRVGRWDPPRGSIAQSNGGSPSVTMSDPDRRISA
jgi:hypothetical protein